MAVSLRQIQANRRNALKSTGPRTARGKARASRNALKHGLFAERPWAPGEDTRPALRLWRGLIREFRPRNAEEVRLIDAMVLAAWKLRRVSRHQAALPPTPDNLAELIRLGLYVERLQHTIDRHLAKLRRSQSMQHHKQRESGEFKATVDVGANDALPMCKRPNSLPELPGAKANAA